MILLHTLLLNIISISSYLLADFELFDVCLISQFRKLVGKLSGGLGGIYVFCLGGRS